MVITLLNLLTSAQIYADSWRFSLTKKTDTALKLGVLSSATINVAAVIHPVQSHSDVLLYAIASRDASKAASLISQYHFQKSYGSYQELISDPEVDLVYVSVPNAFHFEWAMKALDAGKHVILEKPFTSNAHEAEILVEKARRNGKVLLESRPWEFHPAAHRFRQILDSNEFGGILKTEAGMTSISPVPPGDFRWKFDLSGGSLMDMNNVLSLTRFILHEQTPVEIISATATPSKEDERVDSSMLALMRFKLPNVNPQSDQSDIFSTIYTDMARHPAYGLIPRVWELPAIRVETDLAELYFYNASAPHLYHYIAITTKETKRTMYERVYTGGLLWRDRGSSSWSSYRYQLEAVVDKIRGRNPVWWIDGDDSIAQMKTIDMIYEESGLPPRSTHGITD